MAAIKRVLIIASDLKTLVRFRLHLIKELIALGHELHVIMPQDLLDQVDAYELSRIGVKLHGVNIKNTAVSFRKDIKLCIELYGVIKKIKPDIVLAYTIKPVIYGSVIARLVGVKQVYVMITGIGSALLGESLKRRVFQVFIKGLYRISMPSCKKVFFQNADDAELFQKLKLVCKKQVVLINGSGVDLSYYQYKELPQTLCFLLIARIIREKGVFEFIEAARRLKLKYPEVNFKILGDFHSNPTAVLREQFFGLVSTAGVEFLGEHQDVRPFIELSSVFVLPSYREGVPRSALEAMAMGRPIITTDAPGCRETVFEGENGYLVPVKNIDALVEKMEHLINHSDLIMGMGQKSRQIAEDKFDVHQVNQKIINEVFGRGELS